MIDSLKKKLIVSCQAWPGTPFYGDPRLICAMAESAYNGGAGGIRANGEKDILEIKKNVPLPVIGIYKLPDKRGVTVITPDFQSAKKLADAGSDIIAIDASYEARPNLEELHELIHQIKTKLGIPVMADISNLEEAIRAEKCGADIVATTMAGYTPYTTKTDGPDLDLIESIVKKVKIPVFGEGRFSKPEEVNEAINDRGAHSVVIGTSITAPWEITKRFVRAI
ncbi:N-acylglucosamine-6-phosphate 2-epimerase [Bacillus oleivorans]|uniref:N-acylglucosamine-6-phosphate 2-epimerase n=1 Tax=Bacillus oleivorans TaxID=1448271 RepID=A0A285CHY3_9BACI|nr:N-acetylmannosamine-6-phosphate 2-epimerase [Bacillus oleivorans]SNX67119.1 N-acylglucosamine-6-phosphate 2-epimerase [Bacillus oleivorans]